MPLDLSTVGHRGEPVTVSWDSTRAILYALGVGAGSDDPELELEYTTENSIDLEQAVLPTFPVALTVFPESELPWSDIDTTRILHADQALTLHTTLPVQGTAQMVSTVEAVYDKGTGAVVELGNRLLSPEGDVLAETLAGAFIRGEGGFGGERGPASSWRLPQRKPDAVVEQATMPWQALLYRLSGERSPLHTDPEFAALGGFDRPILQGACTYGFAGRALLQTVCEGDPQRFGSMSARFAAPVIPGDVLRTSIWQEGDQTLFVTHTGKGTLVLDRGVATQRAQTLP
jgi:acyl dehydratase